MNCRAGACLEVDQARGLPGIYILLTQSSSGPQNETTCTQYSGSQKRCPCTALQGKEWHLADVRGTLLDPSARHFIERPDGWQAACIPDPTTDTMEEKRMYEGM